MVLELTHLADLRATVAEWRAAGDDIAFVPTMGALHQGHLALVREAKKHSRRVVVSIFVNPTQFGPNEDFAQYPRPVAQDLERLSGIRADAVWLPSVAEIYPNGFATTVHVAGVSEGLCGAARPGHFDGVATVVAKLLLQVAPDYALFGEKDYQQLCVVKRLVADLNINTTILGIPTVRDVDGLALSSRNQYLSPAGRVTAPKLYQILSQTAKALTPRMDLHAALERTKAQLLAAGFDKVDYLELRAEDSLAPLTHHATPSRLLAAVWLGKTRLIDNVKCGG